MKAAVLAGLGAWVPPHVVTNDQLAQRLDTSDEWIRTRTGIGQRHVAPSDLSTAELARQAGERALASAGTRDVDAVVLATTTPDRTCPATAPRVADLLGLTGLPAFDVAAVCTGFLYGLAVGAGLITSGVARRVLLVGAEVFTRIIDPDDRTTAAVFGDGAGAVVLREGDRDEPGALGEFVLGSDGSLTDLITVRPGEYFSMQGRAVFAHAVTRMVESAKAALAGMGWQARDINRLVGHQANLRILHAVADQLELARDRLSVHLDRVGNTAAASIPLALADGHADGSIRKGDRIVLAAFGGGATWGATAFEWPKLEGEMSWH